MRQLYKDIYISAIPSPDEWGQTPTVRSDGGGLTPVVIPSSRSAVLRVLSAAVGALYIVEGLGGSRRSRDGAASRVVAAATLAGWTPSIVSLDAMAQRVGDPDVDVVRVVLCGGDGLIHRALPSLVETGVEVAVVPVGSGNDFARAFGISAAAAVALATSPAHASPPPAGVDVIVVDDGGAGSAVLAASVLTAGYTGRVNATANRMRFPPGSAKYTVAALREIGRLRPVEARLVLMNEAGDEQQVIDGPLTMFAIGNTGYFGGGMNICPSADATDAHLDVVALGPVGRVDFMRWLPRVFRGEHLDHPAVTTGRAAQVRVESSEPLWADGESLDVGVVEPHRHLVGVRSAALRLLRPET
jgi:diacylglycerol kinase (ATP)